MLRDQVRTGGYSTLLQIDPESLKIPNHQTEANCAAAAAVYFVDVLGDVIQMRWFEGKLPVLLLARPIPGTVVAHVARFARSCHATRLRSLPPLRHHSE
jgi:hypothetical protein